MSKVPKYHFHETAQDIRLDGWILRASLQRLDGSWNAAQLSLNRVLGNDNGSFKWSGDHVGKSAKDPTLVFWEGYPIVRASLQDNNNDYHETDYNLSDRIGNYDGNFIFTYRGQDHISTSDPNLFRGLLKGSIFGSLHGGIKSST